MARNENLVKFAMAYPRAFGLILILIGACLAGYYLIWPAIQMERQVDHISYSSPVGAVGGLVVILGIITLIFGDAVVGISLMEHSDRIERYGKSKVYICYALLFLASIAFYIFCDHYIEAHGYKQE